MNMMNLLSLYEIETGIEVRDVTDYLGYNKEYTFAEIREMICDGELRYDTVYDGDSEDITLQLAVSLPSKIIMITPTSSRCNIIWAMHEVIK